MATVIRTSLRTVLARIKDKLVADLIPADSDDPIPSHRVIISIRKKVPRFTGDSDIIIRKGGFKVKREVTDYGGRHDTRIVRRIEIICRSRLDLDEPASDETFLLDETLGHVALEELVADCLQDHLLTESDDSDNAILCCGMQLEEGSEAKTDAEASKGMGYGDTSLFFYAEYTLKLAEHTT